MSDEKPAEDVRIPSGEEIKEKASKPLPPRTIAAQSQARNSITKIWILGSLAFALLILGGIALCVRPEMARDMVWASVSLAAYLAGSGEFSRKEEK